MTLGRQKWAVIGDLFIAASNGSIPSDDNWNAYIHDLKTKPFQKYLHIAASNTEVTSLQRKAAFEAFTSRGVKCAVLTESGVVRGVVTAASWFGVDVKAFKVEALPTALSYLSIDPNLVATAQRTALQLRKEVETG